MGNPLAVAPQVAVTRRPSAGRRRVRVPPAP